MIDPADGNPFIMELLAAGMVCTAVGYVIWFFIDYFKNGES